MKRTLGVTALLAVAVALAACRGGSSASSPAARTPVIGTVVGTIAAPVTPTPVPTHAAAPAGASCDQLRPHGSGDSDESIVSGGRSRTYILHVPPSYDGARRLPLVVDLHGAGSNAREQVFYSQFNRKADDEGFITVTPDALGDPQAWNFIPTASGADDVGFVRDVLDRVESQLCIDETRVYATGISSGGAMSVRLACSLQDRIAAIGPVAAIWYPPGCPTARAMPVIEFHGTQDPLVPYGGGPGVSGLNVPKVEDAIASWAKADGCAEPPARQDFSAHVRTTAYSECRDAAAVELWTVDGGGHTWPGAPIDVTRFGATTHEVSATDEIWSFFAAHTLR
ncbi:MAG TPA: PHB depolymerase family esterase [Dehalococcoidia bacterium]|nr:PHB depolymerase family esterase [Dehalococcoidia bacterium]